MKKSFLNTILDKTNFLDSFLDHASFNWYNLIFTNGYSHVSYTMEDDGLFFHRFQEYIGEYVSKRYTKSFINEYTCLHPNRRDSFEESMVKIKRLKSGTYYMCPAEKTILEIVLSYDNDLDKWKFDFTAIGECAESVIEKINYTWQKMKFTSYKYIIDKSRRVTVNECVVYNTQNGPKQNWSQTPTLFKDISEVICADKSHLLTRIDNFMNSEDIYKLKNVPYRLGILLYGPPGTGKSTLALSLVDYVGAYITINVTVSSLTQIRLWWNNKNHKSVTMNEELKKHSNGRRVMFIIEEIDQWFNDNDDEDYKTEKIHELLQFIDSLDNQAIVIGTTNHYDSLSKALIRAGRFDLKIQMGEFNKESALEFIHILNVDENLLDLLTPDENGNYSPVEIQDLAFQMRLASIHKELDIDDDGD